LLEKGGSMEEWQIILGIIIAAACAAIILAILVAGQSAIPKPIFVEG
jgi:hypothetical protein